MDRQKTFANYEQQLYILQQEKHIVISDAASAQNILEQIGYFPLSRTGLKLESHAFGQIQNSGHRYIIFHIKRKSTTRTSSASCIMVNKLHLSHHDKNPGTQKDR